MTSSLIDQARDFAAGRHVSGVVIREAEVGDAQEVCKLLCLSISTLCVNDHQNDAAILGAWLGNKTPETLRSWIENPAGKMLVAAQDGAFLAVGGVMRTGEITLNYVHPSARWRGISKRMIVALEALAKEFGASECTLNSTGTARRFYLAQGYTEQAPQTGMFGTTVYPMSKRLS